MILKEINLKDGGGGVYRPIPILRYFRGIDRKKYIKKYIKRKVTL